MPQSTTWLLLIPHRRDEHGKFGSVDDPLSLTAEHQAPDSPSAVGANHDAIGLGRLGHSQKLSGDAPNQHLAG